MSRRRPRTVLEWCDANPRQAKRIADALLADAERKLMGSPLTPWFKCHEQPPVRSGWYEYKASLLDEKVSRCWWDGMAWSLFEPVLIGNGQWVDSRIIGPADAVWRGLKARAS
jgi:hypothetical protein